MPDDQDTRIKRVLRLELPVVVQLGQTRMSMGDLASLVPGQIIDLPTAADAHLELFVNNCSVGSGSVVKVGENYGIQIEVIGTRQERAEAVASGPEESQSPSDPNDPAAIAAALLSGQ